LGIICLRDGSLNRLRWVRIILIAVIPNFIPALIAFVQSSRTKKAMIAYEKALEWQNLFDLVLREGIKGDELLAVARRVAGNHIFRSILLKY
jgi:hypothetical protein